MLPMDLPSPKFLLALALLTVAIGGGLLIAWRSVRTARGPREKTFVKRAGAGAGSLMALFIVLLFGLEPPYRYVALVVFLVLIPAAIYRWSTQHQLIRRLDARDAAAHKPPDGR